MNLKTFLLFIIVITGGCAIAQGPANRPPIVWQKCFGGTSNDNANDVVISCNGSILIVGNSRSNNGDVTGHHGSADYMDGWVIKLDADTNIQWQRSLGGSGEDDLTSVVAGSDSSYYCIGYTNSVDGDLPPGPPPSQSWQRKAWVAKISGSGALLWSKIYGDSYPGLLNGIAVSDGNIIITGNGFIFKINPAGDVLWQLAGLGANSIIENNSHKLITSTGYSIDINTGDTVNLHWQFPQRSYVTSIARSGNNILMAYDQQQYNEFCFGGGGVEPGTNIANNVGYFQQNDIDDMISEQWYLSYCPDGGRYGGPGVGAAVMHGLAASPGNAFIAAGNMNTAYDVPIAQACLYISGGVFSLYGAPRGDINWTDFRSVKIYPSGNEFICVGTANINGGDVSGMHGTQGSFSTDFWVVKLSRLTANWTGAIDTAWENPGNWSTNAVPDKSTKAVIPASRPNYPVVNSNAVCYTLQVDSSTSVTVNTGFNIEITGK